MAKGSAWMLLFRITAQVLSVVSTIILARLLVPEDFGLIAMAMSIVAILELLSTFNFDLALIQKPNAEHRHYDTAWTFNVIFGVCICILLLLLAKPAAIFYNEPRLEHVVCFLSLSSLVQGFENIGIVQLRKEMEFRREFKFLFSKRFAGFCITIPLAIFFRSYWALAVGMVFGTVFGVLLSYIMHSYRPRLSLRAREELFKFSKWLLFSNILGFFRTRFSDFIIGRIAGLHSLGLYNIAFEISNMPSTYLVAPINRAVYPGYTKLLSNHDDLRENFLNVFSILVILLFPVSVGITLTADLVVRIFLGDNWLGTVPLMQLLSIAGAITASQSNSGYACLAMGRIRTITVLTFIYVVILVPILIYSVKERGALGAAYSLLISALAFMPVYMSVVCRILGISASWLLSYVWRPLSAAMLMVVVVLLIRHWFSLYLPADRSLIELTAELIVVSLSGAVAYVTSIYFFWKLSGFPPVAEHHIFRHAGSVFGKLRTLLKFA